MCRRQYIYTITWNSAGHWYAWKFKIIIIQINMNNCERLLLEFRYFKIFVYLKVDMRRNIRKNIVFMIKRNLWKSVVELLIFRIIFKFINSERLLTHNINFNAFASFNKDLTTIIILLHKWVIVSNVILNKAENRMRTKTRHFNISCCVHQYSRYAIINTEK